MSDKVFSVKRFLGLNEYTDSDTELKPGEASRMLNFNITDGGNLTTRPGIRPFSAGGDFEFYKDRKDVKPVFYNGKEWLFCIYEPERYSFVAELLREGETPVRKNFSSKDADYYGSVYKSFEHGGKMWLCWIDAELGIRQDAAPFGVEDEGEPYIPLVISGGTHSGGGVSVEPLNILSDYFRAKYTATDEANVFRLPSYTTGVRSVMIGENTYAAADAGEYRPADNTFVLKDTPADGTELEFVCNHSDEGVRSARRTFFDMRYYEHYNGATDTRTFFYGNGSNLCYYTGVPAHGTGLYVPAGNELAVDFSASPITGMVRHYSRLLVFKPDGVDAITYEPVTLEDGSVIAGFYLRPVSREYGNEAMAQVRLVNNSARTLSSKGVYDWHLSAGNYRDERYAKRVSNAVSKTLAEADLSGVITCDDEDTKTWYAFLNDADNNVLVHRYDLDAWCLYRHNGYASVENAFMFDRKVVFQRDGLLYVLDPERTVDIPYADSTPTPINALWESGFQDFGAAWQKKDSNFLWISMLPEEDARISVNTATDQQTVFVPGRAVEVGMELAEEFGDATPSTDVPYVCRLRKTEKRFVWYKLRLSSRGSGRVTILGYDQHIRFSSKAK